jgi:hypothetical protein
MYVCVHVFVYVVFWYLSAICPENARVRLEYVCMHVCMAVHMCCACIKMVKKRLLIRYDLHVCMYVYMHVCMYTAMFVDLGVYDEAFAEV